MIPRDDVIVIGLDWGDLANVGKTVAKAAGGVVNLYAPGAGTGLSNLAESGIDQGLAYDQREKSAAEDERQLQAAILVDRQARDAVAQSLFTAWRQSIAQTAAVQREAKANKAAADAALSAMDAAELAPALQARRQEAAKTAVNSALADYKTKSAAAKSDKTKIMAKQAQFAVQAAQQVAARISSGGSPSGGGFVDRAPLSQPVPVTPGRSTEDSRDLVVLLAFAVFGALLGGGVGAVAWKAHRLAGFAIGVAVGAGSGYLARRVGFLSRGSWT